MKEFIEYLVKQIVTLPDNVLISQSKEGNDDVYKIKVANSDMGIIIGKEGRTIKSLRNLAKAKAIVDNQRISVILEDDQRDDQI